MNAPLRRAATAGATAALAAGMLFAMTFAQSAVAATLTADYRFQNSLSSVVPGAVDMQTVGTGDQFVTETVGCAPQPVLSFPKHSGVQVQNPNVTTDQDTGNYSIVLDFRLADLSGYRRIFDPSGFMSTTFTSDNGLYDLNGSLAIWDAMSPGNPFVGSPGALQPNTYVEVAFTWDAVAKGNKEPGYVNGVESLSSYAPNSGAFYAYGMRFFKDNDPPANSIEDSAGAVSRIRIYYGILTPEEVAAIYADGPLAGACNPARRPSVAVNGKVKVKRGRHGRFVVLTGIAAACPDGGTTCTGSASVTPRGASSRLASASKAHKPLGKAKLSVRPGKTKAVKVKLTTKGSNALRKAGELKAKISVSLASPGGPRALASRTAKLRAPQ